MTDNKMTESEVMESLKICTTYGAKCSDCPAYVKVDRSKCKEVLKGAVEIINSKNAEIERLQKESIGKCEMAIAMRNDNNLDVNCNYCIDKAKSEAVKEFAERLKESKYQSSDWSHGEHPYVVEVSDIDNLVEEMVGEQNVPCN
jgi:L-lactate utilization protein LutB